MEIGGIDVNIDLKNEKDNILLSKKKNIAIKNLNELLKYDFKKI